MRLDSENDVVVGPFFAAVAGLLDDPALLPALRDRHQQLLATAVDDRDPGPTAENAAVALALLAADQTVTSTVPELGPRRRLLERALVEPLAEITRTATAAALDTADDPFGAMVATARAREEYAFGSRFVFDHPVDDVSEFISEVRHCYFHELLTARGAGHLTSILCAFDTNWMDAVDPRRHGFTVDRRTSIATGGTSCPFHLRRTVR